MQESTPQPQPNHDEIAALAHQLWEKNGRPAGQDVAFWLQAEHSLLATLQKPPPAGAPSAKPPAPRAKRPAAKPSKGG